jgi:hypothetical protein
LASLHLIPLSRCRCASVGLPVRRATWEILLAPPSPVYSLFMLSLSLFSRFSVCFYELFKRLFDQSFDIHVLYLNVIRIFHSFQLYCRNFLSIYLRRVFCPSRRSSYISKSAPTWYNRVRFS